MALLSIVAYFYYLLLRQIQIYQLHCLSVVLLKHLQSLISPNKCYQLMTSTD